MWNRPRVCMLLLYNLRQASANCRPRFMPFRSAKRLFQFLLVTAILHCYTVTLDKNLAVYAQGVQQESQQNDTSLNLSTSRLVDRTFTESSFSSSSSSPVRDSGDGMPFGFSGRATGASEGGGMVYRYPQVPLDVENYPVAPSSLQLEQVHVFVRHGESPLPSKIPIP